MRQIGFKNFRRFENFPPINLAPITIFVGENNAGKSTVVKGILALSDFLNGWRKDLDFFIEERGEKKLKKIIIERLRSQKFYFNTSYLSHIGTFKRALYNKADNDIISFYTKLGLQEITIEVFGDKNDDEAVCGVISKIIVDYSILGIHIEFDLQADLVEIIFSSVFCLDTEQLLEYFSQKEVDNIKSFLETGPYKYALKYNISDYYSRFTLDLMFALIKSVEIAINSTIEPEKTNNYFSLEVLNKLKPIENINKETIEFLKKYIKKVCQNQKGEKWIFRLPGRNFIGHIFQIEYLYAHAVTQTVIYSAKDTNDYLSRTIHEFASMPKITNDYRRDFIKHWMKEFNIGEDYVINSVGGEAHIVKIKNNDGEFVNLADKGMGSIQLMVLLFRLAITLPKQPFYKKDESMRFLLGSRRSSVVIIEEPEQNLHPKLQSKLADLFYKLHIEYGYRFIIETHSEYMIRKTQVLVAQQYKKNCEWKNPFKVYYFRSDGVSYDMGYQKNGKFLNSFGGGFFDVSTNLSMDLLDMEE